MPRRDVCFLTGPNMAGKSTYMKTLGMAGYLGTWSVCRYRQTDMKTVVFQGLFSTISFTIRAPDPTS